MTTTFDRNSLTNCYSVKGKKIFVPISGRVIHVYDFNFDTFGTNETSWSIQGITCSHYARLLYVLTDKTLSFYDTKTLEKKVSVAISDYTRVSCVFSPTKDQVLIKEGVLSGVFDESQYVPILNTSKKKSKEAYHHIQ